jgi:DNA modification methylase
MKLQKIYNEDCIETLRRMPDAWLDMTLCSPPYDDLRKYNGYELQLEDTARLLFDKTKSGGVVVWVTGDKTNNGSESLSSFQAAIIFVETGFRLHDTMIYEKNNPIPSDCGPRYRQAFEYIFCFSKGAPKTFNPITEPTRSPGKEIKSFRITGTGRNGNTGADRSANPERKVSNIFTYSVGTSSATDKIAFGHPAIFPERLAEDQIRTWSNEGDLVYDCFMGSGTTAKVARALGRRWIGSEISAEYCAIAERRLALKRSK